ncbi:MAG: murein biosynthesis integral membrane protein MurJ, partial [Proteobacteria bacterium]|nr:murein biosynthesis integral membrane protein MurJ [Pseudomonadota bacterium]
YVDQVLASYLGESIVAAMANAQTLYLLPVSLFGMAISAAELPEMASQRAGVQERLRGSLRRVVFLVVPSAIALATIGGSIVALLFQTGRFGAHDTTVVWTILVGSVIGLSAGTQGRLLASAFYALEQPRPPLYAALVRVAITGVAGYAFALPLRSWLGYGAVWGGFGLTASAGVAAWVEFLLLERWLSAQIGKVPIPTRLGLGALGAALLAGGAGYGASWLAIVVGLPGWLAALGAIGTFGVVYLGVMIAAKVPEAAAFTRRLRRRR